MQVFDIVDEILHTLLLGTGGGDLLFEGGDLFADIRFTNIYRTQAGCQLHLFQVQLGTVYIAQQGTGIQSVAFLHVQFHNLSVCFGRNQYFGRFKGTGSIKIVVSPVASGQAAQYCCHQCIITQTFHLIILY